MAQQLIGIGTVPNDGTGDTLPVAGKKLNENFSELYTKSLQRWVVTTDGMTLELSTNYRLQPGHTVHFPVANTGNWIRILPENGDWYSLNGTLESSAAIDSQQGVPADSILTFLYSVSNIKVRT